MPGISDIAVVNLANRGINPAEWDSIATNIKMNTVVADASVDPKSGLLTVRVDLASRPEERHEMTMQTTKEFVIEPAIAKKKGTLRVNFDEDSARAYDGASSRN